MSSKTSIALILLLAAPANAICLGLWSQRTPSMHPLGRQSTAMVYDSVRGVCVLYGGDLDNLAHVAGDTWEWDDVGWTNRSPVNASPAARSGHALVYDPVRQVTVLFGGNFTDETWEWNGNIWTQRSPTTSPPGRDYHAMTYDTDRHVVVLYGGAVPGGFGGVPVGDTWEYDGTTWTQRFPTIGPPILAAHSIVFDSIRHQTVLFGGTSDLTHDSADTWVYDGTTWARAQPAQSPSARRFNGMVFDSNKGVVVMFGGITSSNRLSDTWQWDGSNWVQQTYLDVPAGRASPGMAYDIAHAQTVLFGGQTLTSAGTVGDDQTWTWISDQPLITQQPADLSVSPGHSAILSLTAINQGLGTHPPLTYQWRKNGTGLTDGGAISGATTATLSINPAAPSAAGQYDCVVSNCGSTVSRTVTLNPCKPASVTDDCNNNGIADACDIAADPTIDADKNGVIDTCQPPAAAETTPDAQDTSTGGSGTQDVVSPQAMPCGTCGGGAAGMMPFSLLGLISVRRRLRKVTRRKSSSSEARVSPSAEYGE